MKRLPVINSAPAWRSLDDNAQAKIAPPDAEDASISRRSFLQVMGASVALGSLAGCRRPAESIYPYGRAPEDLVPGRPQRYASAMPLAGTAFGVVVESHEGRPTKIEGNPLHPDSLGAASAFVQAAVLELYDPDRATSPIVDGETALWSELDAWLRGTVERSIDGSGLAILTEAHRSPALEAQLNALRARYPKVRIVRYDAWDRTRARAGAQLAFGQALDPVYAIDRADVIMTLDADPLFSEGSAVKHARHFADGRDPSRRAMNRLYAIESRFSVTGAEADHRLRVRSSRVYPLALALAQTIGGDLARGLPDAGPLSKEEQRFVHASAADLQRAGARALVIAGDGQPAAVHAIAQRINAALASEACTWRPPFSGSAEGEEALAELVAAMGKNQVNALIIVGGNPVAAAPRTLGFAEALRKVQFSAHLSGWLDETSVACSCHLPRAHWLESWGDVRAEDGTWSVIQPLIAPLHGGRTDLELVEALLGGARGAYTIVSDTWRQALGAKFSASAFRRALHDGLLADTATPSVAVRAELAAFPAPADSPASALELTFGLDAHAYDGRFANNAWLQELPEPLTKLTWDNAALIAPDDARAWKLADGDIIELTLGDQHLRVPVLRAPGQAAGSLALTIGQGRAHAGRVAEDVGYDANVLRPVGRSFVGGVSWRATGERRRLAITQEHDRMEGRPLVREATVDEFREEPHFAREPEKEHGPLFNLWADQPQDGHRWGMVIDLQRCLGCNACMAACQSENNIPVVGRDGVLRSREMHWIRVDRYFVGNEAEPRSVMQPIGCQQCEQAPCEQVCPVGATTHSPEGLNDMAYNRCIGTRYCANNCPYKVRRYNFYNYNKEVPELRRMQLNPDVTVRTRGVMEKCTYCVQRINGAKIEAHASGHDRVRDGAVVAACQQTCPAQAISFGDLADPKSVVAQKAADPRRYVLLEELNIRPRTSFLARVRNPNPELG